MAEPFNLLDIEKWQKEGENREKDAIDKNLWPILRRKLRQSGWPDEFVKKIAQNVSKTIFRQN
jgi:hypothetical protein